MTKLFRYLGVTVLQAIFFVMLLLLGLEIFILAISQLNELGRGDYHLGKMFLYVLGNLPLQVYSFFPLTALLGVLLGLGMLASSSELIVMQAAGLSMTRITTMVMKVALMLVLVVTLFGEILGPRLSNRVETMKTQAISLGQALKTSHGIWVRNDKRYIRIDRIEGKTIYGITLYDFNDQHQMMKASYAKAGYYHGKTWVLEQVSQSVFSDNEVIVSHFPTWEVKLTLHPKMLGAEKIEPTQMDLIKLYRYIQYRHANGLQVASYALVFWQRIFQPISTAIMMFLAIPFIFGPLRSATMGHRLVVGILVGFGFYLFNQFVGPASLVYEIPPIVSALAPSLCFALLGLVGYRFPRH